MNRSSISGQALSSQLHVFLHILRVASSHLSWRAASWMVGNHKDSPHLGVMWQLWQSNNSNAATRKSCVEAAKELVKGTEVALDVPKSRKFIGNLYGWSCIGGLGELPWKNCFEEDSTLAKLHEPTCGHEMSWLNDGASQGQPEHITQ